MQLKNARVDASTIKPCPEITEVGINPDNLIVNQTITLTGNTFATNQLFAPEPGDDYWVTWWLSDKAYDKNTWSYPVSGKVFKELQDAFTRSTFTPSPEVLDALKGNYLVVMVVYNYKRLNILEASGLSVLPPTGIGSYYFP